MNKLLFGVVVLAFSASASAITGNELKSICTKSALDNECAIFVHGITEGMDFVFWLLAASRSKAGENVTRPFCVPDTVTAAQLASIVKKQMDARPEVLHHPAQLVVLNALEDAFPCLNSPGEKPSKKK